MARNIPSYVRSIIATALIPVLAAGCSRLGGRFYAQPDFSYRVIADGDRRYSGRQLVSVLDLDPRDIEGSYKRRLLDRVEQSDREYHAIATNPNFKKIFNLDVRNESCNTQNFPEPWRNGLVCLAEIPRNIDNAQWLSEVAKKVSNVVGDAWSLNIARFIDGDMFIMPDLSILPFHGNNGVDIGYRGSIYFENYRESKPLFRLLVYDLDRDSRMDVVRFSHPYSLGQTGPDGYEDTEYDVSGFGLFKRDVLESFQFKSPELVKSLKETADESETAIANMPEDSAETVRSYIDGLKETLIGLDGALVSHLKQK